MKKLISVFSLTSLVTPLLGAPLTFDFKDPKGVNNAAFKLDAPLEAIVGSANGISGTVTFDPANPAETQGKLAVAAKTLQVPNSMMKEHLDSAQWMDVAKFPEITFELKRVSNVKTSGDTTTADVMGTLTVKGVTKEVVAKVTATYLKDKLGARSNGQMQGDLLVLRTNFAIKRSDYGINPGAPQDKVADTIDLTLSVAGFSKRA